jgi:hypothetical protein
VVTHASFQNWLEKLVKKDRFVHGVARLRDQGPLATPQQSPVRLGAYLGVDVIKQPGLDRCRAQPV